MDSVEELNFHSEVHEHSIESSEFIVNSLLEQNSTRTEVEYPDNKEHEEEMKYLMPSEIHSKNYIYYSPTSVNEEECGGRWALFAFKDLNELDNRWKVLQKLCNNNILVAIKSSTATYPEDCLTLCYTSDSSREEEAKIAAEEIQKITDYKYNMCYKANNSFSNTDSNFRGICLYVYTVQREFYRKEQDYLLPTEIDWKTRISYFPTRINKNVLKERGGKWIMHNFGEKSELDQRWIVLRSLCESGTLSGIESSTAIDTSKRMTVCYTSDSANRREVKKAADEIRKLINYDYVMHYIADKPSSTSLRYRLSDSTEICKYIHTVSAVFYEKDTYMRWVCYKFDEEETRFS